MYVIFAWWFIGWEEDVISSKKSENYYDALAL